MAVQKYYIVTSNDPKDLSETVTRILDRGFDLRGDLVVVKKENEFEYIQVMVKH